MSIVSVIIPTYNREEFIRDAIESVLSQGYKDLEIIVVDDGSTDDTKLAVDGYVQRYSEKIFYFYQKNAGPASARNLGVRHARGEYIAFLDSDDLWTPDSLEKRVALLKSNPDAGLVYGAYQRFTDGEMLGHDGSDVFYSNLPAGNVYQDLLMKCFIFTTAVFMRKSVFEAAGGFDESLCIGEDYDLWLRVANNCKIFPVNGIVAQYRQHKKNIMHTDCLYDIPGEVAVVQGFVKRHPDCLKGVSKFRWQKRLSQPYFDLAYKCFHEKNFRRALFFICSALQHFPFRLVYWKYFVAMILLSAVYSIKKNKDD